MSGSWSRNEKDSSSKEGKEGEGSGWASTFLKVAGAVAATAAVAGSLYSILQQPEAEVAPYGVQQTRRRHQRHEEEEEEEVILHVDGSLKRDEQSAGCGGYLSSSPSQNWICGFVQKLKFTPNLKEHETEKEAILRGMRWAKNEGWRNVVVNSDCKTVVDFVKSNTPSNDPLIREIRDLIDSDEWEATLSWISRSKNGEADKLADKAHSCRSLELHQSNDRSYLLN